MKSLLVSVTLILETEYLYASLKWSFQFLKVLQVDDSCESFLERATLSDSQVFFPEHYKQTTLRAWG